VELGEIMRAQHACRYFRPDPVGDDVLYTALEMARFAPNGGNRNAVRSVLVRDPDRKRRLGELYLPLWREVTAAVAAGPGAVTSASGHRKSTRLGFSNPAAAALRTEHGRALTSPPPVLGGSRPAPDESDRARPSTSTGAAKPGAPAPAQPATGREETRTMEHHERRVAVGPGAPSGVGRALAEVATSAAAAR
jgi:nitroreductase